MILWYMSNQILFSQYCEIIQNLTFSFNVINPQTSILALYLNLLLGYTASSVVMSVFILRIHHKPATMPVGHKMRTLAGWLKRRMFCASCTENPNRIEIMAGFEKQHGELE